MKRSSKIILGAVFLAAISSCSDTPKEKDEWITGADKTGKTRDTIINNQHYRHYGMGWFLLANAHIRSGGFGSSGRSSSVHS